ncbi:MAG: LysM domain-containing protein [Chloroflexota bacterium]
MKIPRWVAISLATTLLLLVAIAMSALTYTVRSGDTLSELAQTYNTSVDAIANANGIANPNVIRTGQQLEIPNADASASSAAQAPTVFPVVSAPAVHYVSTYPPIAPFSGVVARGGAACTRFNFEQGRDSITGARAGVYIMEEVTAGELVRWNARAGAVDSGWFDNIAISYESVHVRVWYYPADGTAPTRMRIVNHAPRRSTGWLSRGMCHAMEIEFP